QRDHDFHILETLQFAIEIRSTVRQFPRKRLVVRRRTANGSSDVNICQLKAGFAIGGVGLVGKAGLIQHRKHEFARRVSGERPPGAIGAVRSGSESENKHPRPGIAEARYGLSPVLALAISPALLARNLFAVFDQSRTTGAGNDLGIEFDQPVAIGSYNSHAYNCTTLAHSAAFPCEFFT